MIFKSKTLDSGVKWLLSVTLTTAPFYGLQASAEPTVTMAAESALLDGDTNALNQRALFPLVPRSGATGLPTDAELGDIEKRVQGLRAAILRDLPQRLQNSTSDASAAQILKELSTYFGSAQRLETIKLVTGHKVTPETYDRDYAFDIPLTGFAQGLILRAISLNGRGHAALGGFTGADDSSIEKLSFLADLVGTGADQRLHLSLKPYFLKAAEESAWQFNPNTRNALIYTLQLIATRLFESQVVNDQLLRMPMNSIPSAAPALRERFSSFRVAHAFARNVVLRRMNQEWKPKAFRLLLNAIDRSYACGRGYVIDANFFQTVYPLLGFKVTTDQLAPAQADEKEESLGEIAALFDLSDVASAMNAGDLIFNAKRIALRKLYFQNENLNAKMDAALKAKIAALIEQGARAASDQILADNPGLNEVLAQAYAQNQEPTYLVNQRAEFQKGLETIAQNVKTFENQNISIAYLLEAHAGELEPMASPFITPVVQSLQQASSYGAAYTQYKEVLLNYLLAFKIKAFAPKAQPSLEEIFAAAKGATLNSNVIAGDFPPEYLNTLITNHSAAETDLARLVRIGEILHFAAYEKLASGSPATPRTVDLTRSWFGWLTRSQPTDYADYLKAMKNDLFKTAPILGAVIPDSKQQIWEFLADPTRSPQAKHEVVERQLHAVAAQIKTDLATTLRILAQVDGAADRDNLLEQAGPELQTLLLRASLIAYSLQSHPGLGDYYSEMRTQVVGPDFTGRRVKHVSDWANGMATWLMIYFIAGKVARFAKAFAWTEKALSPLLGPSGSHFNLLLFAGVFGLGVAPAAKAWLRDEPRRLQTLQDFYNCGGGSACVAIYADVVRQEDILSTARSEVIWKAGEAVAVVLGFNYAGKAIRWLQGRFLRVIDARAQASINILGLHNGANLSQASVEEATRAALGKARALPNPIARAAGEALAMDAHNNLERAIWEQALKWKQFENVYVNEIQELNLGTLNRNWKDPMAVNEAASELVQRHRAGEVSSYEFTRLRQILGQMRGMTEPYYNKMSKDPMADAFMRRAWSSGSGISTARIEANLSYFKTHTGFYFEDELKPFIAAEGGSLKQRLGNMLPGAGREQNFDNLLQRMALMIERDPMHAAPAIQSLLRAYARAK